MKRHLTQALIQWKNSPYRKPLIVQGARQVGKTYLINEFGREHYQNLAYFNFETDRTLHDFFSLDLNPKRIIERLSYHSGQTILPETTLIIFDEIQASDMALTSLKVFNEQAKQYHIIASGSFLGVALNAKRSSFPVGQVDMMHLYPMDFKEFLMAMDQDYLINQIEASYVSKTKLDEGLHRNALDLYAQFLVVGGMPAVLKLYVETKDYALIRNEQNKILDNYLMDMAKYSTASDIKKTRMIYASLSTQLTRENKKFQYSQIKSGGRSKTFEGALEWLTLSSIVVLCHKIKDIRLPAKAYLEDGAFKAYMSDCGLLCAQSGIRHDLILMDSPLIALFKGGLVENAVYNQLIVNGWTSYYWESNGIAEVDFILDAGDRLIPLEVKSSTHVRSKSLNRYLELFKPENAYRVSSRHFGNDETIISIPLYATFCIKKK